MQGLCTYLPSSILDFLYTSDQDAEPPLRQDYETVVLFADVSGFTKLSEAFADRGRRGHELLKKCLNSYFELLMRESTSQGGDIFKFAGDAILVVWPRSNEALARVTRRAVQCAIQIREQLTGYKILDPDRRGATDSDGKSREEMVLNVKLGIGVGKISILHIGGYFGRMEYVATGEPLSQSFNAESLCDSKDAERLVIASPEVWAMVKDHFDASRVLESGHACISTTKRGMMLPKVSVFKTTTSLKHIRNEPDGSKLMKRVTQYVPGAVRPFVKDYEESWADEIRTITVLFVNLGLQGANETFEDDDELKRVHLVLQTVQRAVYKYEGSLNKFLMDDKGSTLIAVFGLPPLAHEDDPVRGLLSALQICTQLHKLNLVPSIGVTTGTAFCGVIGTRNRREYSILGDTVNLAARLMSWVDHELGGGVLCDPATRYAARKTLKFTSLEPITVKGKSRPVPIFHPYPKDYVNYFTKDKISAPQSERHLNDSEAGNSYLWGLFHSSTKATGNTPGRKSWKFWGGKSSRRGSRSSGPPLGDKGAENDGPLHGRAPSTQVPSTKAMSIVRSKSSVPPPTRQLSKTPPPPTSGRKMRRARTGLNLSTPGTSHIFTGSISNGSSGTTSVVSLRSPPQPPPPPPPLPTRFVRIRKAFGGTQTLQRRKQSRVSGSNPEGLPKSAPVSRRASNSIEGFSEFLASVGSTHAQTPQYPHGPQSPSSRGVEPGSPSTPNHMYARSKRWSLSMSASPARRKSEVSQDSMFDFLEPEYRDLMASDPFSVLETKSSYLDVSETKLSAKDKARLTLLLREIQCDAEDGARDEIQIDDTLRQEIRDTIDAERKRNSEASTSPSQLPESGQGGQSLTPRQKAWDNVKRTSVMLGGLALSAKCKVIQVTLPPGFGKKTMDCTALVSVGQIINKVFAKLEQKRLPLPGKSPSEFEMWFSDGHKPISNETKILELPTLRSIRKHERKRWCNFRKREKPMTSVERRRRVMSLVNDDTFTQLDSMVDSLGGVHKGDLMELDMRPRGQHTDKIGREKLEQERLRAVEGPQMKRLRGMLLSKVRECIEIGRGGQVLICADMGNGKTKLLETTIEMSKHQSRIYYTISKPLEAPKPLSLFADVFSGILDQEIHKNYQEYTGTLRENRRRIILSKLKKKNVGFGVYGVAELAPVLNSPLNLNFDENRFTLAMSPSERAAAASQLMVYLLQIICAAQPCVIIIDDAINLTPVAWKFIQSLALDVDRLLLILATRPLNRSYMAAFAKSVPEEYKNILAMDSTLFVPIRPLSDNTLYKIACVTLSVLDLPPMLADFILRKANGNPKVVKEFIYDLQQELVFRVEDGEVILREGIKWEDLADDLQCPFSVRALLARRLDRLEYQAHVMLKIAALAGVRFSFRVIKDSFPLRDRKCMEREFENLKRMDIIKKAAPPLVGVIDEADIEWCMVDPFMRSMLINRLITNQIKQLKFRIMNARVERFVEMLAQMKRGGPIRAVAHSAIEILMTRQGTQVWEEYYCVLSHRGLFVLASKAAWESQNTSKSHIQFYIGLSSAVVYEVRGYHSRSFTIEIKDTTDYYSKYEKSFYEKPRNFHIALDEYNTMVLWCNAMKDVTQQKISREVEKKNSLAHRKEKWRKILEIKDRRKRRPYSTLEKKLFEDDMKFVKKGFTSEHSEITSPCYVKKASGIKILASRYKRRQAMLAIKDSFVPNKHACIFVITKIPSKADEQLQVTDAVSLNTRKCFVREHEKLEDNMWILTVEGQLWVKRREYNWKEGTILVGFASKEERGLWAHKIQEAIRMNQELPDVTQSLMASEYNSEPGFTARDEESTRTSYAPLSPSSGYQTAAGRTPPIMSKHSYTSSATTVLPSRSRAPTGDSSRGTLASSRDFTVGSSDSSLFETSSESKTTRISRKFSGRHRRARALAEGEKHALVEEAARASPRQLAEPSPDTPTRGDRTSSRYSSHSPARAAATERLLRITEDVRRALNSIDRASAGSAVALLESVKNQLVVLQNGPESLQILDSAEIDPQTRNWIKENYSSRRPPRPQKVVVYPGDGDGESQTKPMLSIVDAVSAPPLDGTQRRAFSLGDLVLPSQRLGEFGKWEWDYRGRPLQDLYGMLTKVYEYYNLFDDFNIEKKTFCAFITEVSRRYLDNPYHNFYHAVDVTQTVFVLLRTMGLDQYLNRLEILSILTAALCHDVQHPGLNNSYHVSAQTPVAVVYNDQSVLENFHTAVTFSILSNPDTNIFSNLTRKQYQQVRRSIVHMVLSTDMTCHFGMLDKFKSLLERKAQAATAKGKASQTQIHRRTLLNVMLHACDISNPAKPWALCKDWSDRISEEFFAQGDREKREALPVSQNMDRTTTDQAAMSLNFIDFIVSPMFVSVRRLLPGVFQCVDTLAENRVNWFRIYDQKVKTRLSGADLASHGKKWSARNKAFDEATGRARQRGKTSRDSIIHYNFDRKFQDKKRTTLPGISESGGSGAVAVVPVPRVRSPGKPPVPSKVGRRSVLDALSNAKSQKSAESQ